MTAFVARAERPVVADQRCSRAAGPSVLNLGVGFQAGQRVTWTTLPDPKQSLMTVSCRALSFPPTFGHMALRLWQRGRQPGVRAPWAAKIGRIRDWGDAAHPSASQAQGATSRFVLGA